MAPQRRFTLGFLLRQVTLFCVILATVVNLNRLYLLGADWERASFWLLTIGLCAANGAFIGGFWGRAGYGAIVGVIVGACLGTPLALVFG